MKVGNDTIYFRGIRILHYAIEALLQLGVNQADQVILTGCSGKMCYIIGLNSCLYCKMLSLAVVATLYSGRLCIHVQPALLDHYFVFRMINKK